MRRLVLLLACTLAVLTLPLSPVSASTPPAAPVLTQSTATATTASFTWGTPASVSPVTRYELRRNGTLVAANLSASLTSYTFNSLTPGSTSTVLLRACSAFGCSPDSSPLTLGTAPAAPTTLAASAAPGSAQLTWSSSAQTHVWFKTSASSTWSEWTPEIPDNSPTTVTGLQNGVAYVLRVEARNAYGSSWSPFSSSTVPRDVPSRPVLVFSRATASAVTVSWTPPTTNGSSITGYKFYKDGVLVASTASVGSYTFTTLNPGSTYAFTAQACNTLGCSTESDVFHSTPLPSASMTVSTVQRDESVEVYWSSSSGASSYRLLYRPALSTTWTEWTPETADSSPTTITGLTNGTAYVFAVAALNPSGASGLALGRGTPRGSPGIPELSLATSPSPTSAPLVWSTPSANGAPISNFKILRDGVEIASRVGSSFTVANLPAGSAPTFVVQACNVAGCTNSNTLSVQLPPQRPSVSVSRSDQSITLTWSTPTSSTATPSVWYKPTSSATWLEWTPGTPDTSPLTVSGLSNGSPYNVKLLLATSAGSVESSVLTAIPVGAPSTAPAAPTSPFSSVATVGLVWASPTDTGGLSISSFRIYRNGSLAATTSGSARNATLTSLASGSWHSLQLQVCNTSGCSPVSLAVSAATLATPPSGFSAVALGESIQLTWTNAPGDAVSGYVIQYTESTATPWLQYGSIQTSSPVTIADLTGRSINVRVCTVDKMGNRCAGTAVVVRTAQDYSPPPPRSLAASPLNGSASLTWAAPSSNPGSAIIDYVIEYRPSTVSDWTQFADGSSTSTSATVSGLLNGTAYLFRVSAVNALGSGAPSASAATTPRTTPSQLAAPTLVAVDVKSVELSWSAPSSDGGAAVSGFALYRDGDLVALLPVSPRTFLDEPLLPGALYAYQVAAVNAAGTAPVSDATFATTLPSAPEGLQVTVHPSALEVSWSDVSSQVVDGYAVLYRVLGEKEKNAWIEWTPGVADSSPTMLTGLTDGTAYEVQVSAFNVSGQSDGVSLFATPLSPPSVPRSLSASAGNASVSLTWETPTSDGGSEVTDYEIEYSSNAGASWSSFADGTSSATSVTVTGLVNGTTYRFRVRACNAAGCGVDTESLPEVVAATPTPPASLSYATTSLSRPTISQTLTPVLANGAASSFAVSGTLPAGVSFNTTTGVFTGPSAWNFKAKIIAAGTTHTCAITSDARVKCWGGNYRAQLGTGATSSMFGGEASPVDVVGVTEAKDLSLGEQHTCVLRVNGTVLCWGRNDYGQVGSGSPSPFETPFVSTPTLVAGLSNVVSIGASGAHTCASLTDGSVKCWGANFYGQLGDNTTTERYSPTTVQGLSNVQRVSVGDYHNCALIADGKVRCWGLNSSGQVGDGSVVNKSTAVEVSGLTDVVQVEAGGYHTCAIRSDARLFCWGGNFYGQVGDGTTTHRSTPVNSADALTFVSVSAAHHHTCALKVSGGVVCWGLANSGRLGVGEVSNSGPALPNCPNSNNLVCYASPQVVAAGSPASIATGGSTSCALYQDGALKCWGENNYGQLGIGSPGQQFTPVSVPTSGPQPGFPTNLTVQATLTTGGSVSTNVVLSTLDVGDVGPGGGIIFAVFATPFACGPTMNLTCTYLEAAPSSFGNRVWSGNTNTLVGTNDDLGYGYQNTTLAVAQDSTADRAVTLADSYSNNGKTDWFLPSKAELNELCKYALQETTGDTTVKCGGSGPLRTGFSNASYWSSSEGNTPASTAWLQDFSTWAGGNQQSSNKVSVARVYPVRAG